MTIHTHLCYILQHCINCQLVLGINIIPHRWDSLNFHTKCLSKVYQYQVTYCLNTKCTTYKTLNTLSDVLWYRPDIIKTFQTEIVVFHKTYIYIYIYIYIHTYIYIKYTHIHTYIYYIQCVCVYVYMYVCVYIYIYIYCVFYSHFFTRYRIMGF